MPNALPVTALAKVSCAQGVCYDDASTRFSVEGSLLHEFYDKARDAYTVVVEDVKVCKDLQVLLHKESRHKGHGLGLSSVTSVPHNLFFITLWLCLASDSAFPPFPPPLYLDKIE